MARKERIVRATADEVEAMRARGESRSDWKAAETMSHAEIERLADEDDGPLPEGWESTVELGVPEPRESIHIRGRRIRAALVQVTRPRLPDQNERGAEGVCAGPPARGDVGAVGAFTFSFRGCPDLLPPPQHRQHHRRTHDHTGNRADDAGVRAAEHRAGNAAADAKQQRDQTAYRQHGSPGSRNADLQPIMVACRATATALTVAS